jgi:hypothetical protein
MFLEAGIIIIGSDFSLNWRSLPNNAAVETYHTYENRSMNAGFTVRKYAYFY